MQLKYTKISTISSSQDAVAATATVGIGSSTVEIFFVLAFNGGGKISSITQMASESLLQMGLCGTTGAALQIAPDHGASSSVNETALSRAPVDFLRGEPGISARVQEILAAVRNCEFSDAHAYLSSSFRVEIHNFGTYYVEGAFNELLNVLEQLRGDCQTRIVSVDDLTEPPTLAVVSSYVLNVSRSSVAVPSFLIFEFQDELLQRLTVWPDFLKYKISISNITRPVEFRCIYPPSLLHAGQPLASFGTPRSESTIPALGPLHSLSLTPPTSQPANIPPSTPPGPLSWNGSQSSSLVPEWLLTIATIVFYMIHPRNTR